jgi:hypothetical protein
VSLGDYSEFLRRGGNSGLAHYAISTVLGNAKTEVSLSAVTTAGSELPAIYLLDGWDEVPASMRSRVLEEIETATEGLAVIITSRLNAAAILTRNPQTQVFELGSLTDGAVSELCSRYGEARDRANLVPRLFQLIESSPSIWPLAGNPYLLTLLCEVIFAASELPRAVDVSPIWVLSSAIDLIRSDYNASHYADPLTRKGLDRIEQLAYALSFDKESKRTSFEPDADLANPTKTSSNPLWDVRDSSTPPALLALLSRLCIFECRNSLLPSGRPDTVHTMTTPG